MNKIGTVFLLSVIAMGAFSSIPNAAAQVPVGLEDKMMQASGTFQPKFGSQQNKVCGLELCNSKSIPNLDLTPEIKEVIKETSPKNRALEKALQGGEASDILANYLAFKGVSIVETPQNDVASETTSFNNFANPDFINPTYQSTVQRTIVEEPEYVVVLPDYLKSSYANEDFPVYEKPVVEKSEIIIEEISENEQTPEGIIATNMTNSMADLILAQLGFDVDVTNIGICGPGTTNIDGICMADTLLEAESVNTDGDDYREVKEEEVETLDNVVMTDGEQALPVNSGEEPIEEPIEDEPVKEEIVIETLTTVPVEPTPEPVQATNGTNSNVDEDSGFDNAAFEVR